MGSLPAKGADNLGIPRRAHRAGESPEAAARRELWEETGAVPGYHLEPTFARIPWRAIRSTV